MSEAITVEVIEHLRNLGDAKLHLVDGYRHIEKGQNITLFKPPVPKAIEIGTLSGFVKLMEQEFEGFEAGGVMVHVSAFDTVQLADTKSDDVGRRQVYIQCTAPKPERTFPFNQFLPQEIFNINLRSMFVEDANLIALQKVAGNIAANAEARQEDDGFSQKVNLKTGVHMAETHIINPRVTLRPFRTFLEVEQPAGDYLFRVKGEGGNTCALIEADAGRWKLTAMDTIKKWLETQLRTSSVEAIREIPVIA